MIRRSAEDLTSLLNVTLNYRDATGHRRTACIIAFTANQSYNAARKAWERLITFKLPNGDTFKVSDLDVEIASDKELYGRETGRTMAAAIFPAKALAPQRPKLHLHPRATRSAA